MIATRVFSFSESRSEGKVKKLLGLRAKTAASLYALIDLLLVGAGMGVPIFPIGFGFVVGWYIVRRELGSSKNEAILRRILLGAGATSLFTLVVMVAVWGRSIAMLFDPASDFGNFGIPLILYSPKASFIGWLALMMLISPFLQLLTTIFASFITLTYSTRPKR